MINSPAAPSPNLPPDIQMAAPNVPNADANFTQDASPSPVQWLAPMWEDEELQSGASPVNETVDKLINDAKRHKAFTPLFTLQAIKSYLDLTAKNQRVPIIRNPRERASLAVAKSVGKGPYFARKIRHLAVYINNFRTLPPTGSGKHHAHPSLLNNERVLHAVRRYLTVVALGEVYFISILSRVLISFVRLHL